MPAFDPASEWQRLGEHYRTLTDEELQAIAAEGYQLTDIAREILAGELRTRGLKAEIVTAPAQAPVEVDEGPIGDELDPSTLDLVPFLRVWSPDEARHLMAALRVEGVPSFLGPDNAHTVELYLGGFAKGAQLKVLRQDAYRASIVFHGLPRPARDEDEPEDESTQPTIVVCPSCRSAEVVFHGVEAEEDDGTHPDAQFHWSCDTCGYEWRDDGVEQEAEFPPDDASTPE